MCCCILCSSLADLRPLCLLLLPSSCCQYILGAEKNGYKVRWYDLWICRLFLFVVMPALSGVGFVSAVVGLVKDWSKYGAPFECKLAGYD